MFLRRVITPCARGRCLAVQSVLVKSTRLLARCDANLINFVDDHLQSISPKPIPVLPGWSEVVMDGGIGTLSRKHNDELITVRFNVNGSMPNHQEQMIISDQGKDIFCRPDYEVLFEHGNGRIYLNCIFGPGDEVPESIKDRFTDVYEIIAATIIVGKKDMPYVIEMNDPEFYDQIANFMEDRAVGNQFATDLASVATLINANLLFQSLQSLRNFLN